MYKVYQECLKMLYVFAIQNPYDTQCYTKFVKFLFL